MGDSYRYAIGRLADFPRLTATSIVVLHEKGHPTGIPALCYQQPTNDIVLPKLVHCLHSIGTLELYLQQLANWRKILKMDELCMENHQLRNVGRLGRSC